MIGLKWGKDVEPIVQFIRTLGVTRIAAMGAVAASLIGFFIYLMVKLSQPQMAVLFTDLQFEDSISVVRKLEGMDVPHDVRQDGAIVLVPKDRVLRLRMELAESGLPSGGSVGYEIFDKSDNLGATSFVQNINRLRAIEGELARTIRALDKIQMARVHLVIPKRKLFAQQRAEPSASIVIKARGRLENGQIKAIQHLVASAVEDLAPGKVSIVDERGKLLASGSGDDGTGFSNSTSDERNRLFENRLESQIEEIVSSVVGAGKVRVSVTAELDYNRITKTSETFDPDGQVVRSTQTRQESSSSKQPSQDGSVSVGNELPAAGTAEDTGNQTEDANKTEETINYEISRTTQTEVKEAGQIQRVSVAVLVDGKYAKTADGKLNYQPRSQAELEQITQLVRSTIGYSQERGDQIHVSNLQFVATEEPALEAAAEGGLFDFSKQDYFHIAELVITLIVSLLVLLFVVRPLVRRILTPEDLLEEAALLELDGSVASEQGAAQLTDASGQPLAITAEETEVANIPPSSAVIALQNAKLEGEVHKQAIKEIGEMIEKHPMEAVSVVQNWINSDAA